jgi:hypothetical protein
VSLVLLLVLAAPPTAVPPSALPAPPVAKLAQPLIYRINRRKQGDYLFESTPFSAVIQRDGSVQFRDKHGALGLLIPLPRPLPAGTATLESSVREALGGARPGSRAAPPGRASAPPVLLEICEQTPCTDPLQVVGAAGASFDVTEEMMRLFGEDPYRYEKARFLAVTAEWRARLVAVTRDRQKDAALANQHQQLLAIWRDRRYTPNERRRLLFNLWLEMDDSPQGRQGAAGIVSFIRQHAPAGSREAFTAGELAAMNSVAAPQRFEPYSGR